MEIQYRTAHTAIYVKWRGSVTKHPQVVASKCSSWKRVPYFEITLLLTFRGGNGLVIHVFMGDYPMEWNRGIWGETKSDRHSTLQKSILQNHQQEIIFLKQTLFGHLAVEKHKQWKCFWNYIFWTMKTVLLQRKLNWQY